MGASLGLNIYLDNNATTRPLPVVIEAIAAALRTGYGNPASAHSAGDAARAWIRSAYGALAALLDCEAGRLLLTSSGTEANNLALHSLAGNGVRRLVTTSIEHSSVLRHAEHLADRGLDVAFVLPAANGRVNPDDFDRALAGVEHAGVSVHWVNNETGVVQPVDDIMRIARRRNALVHIDGAQTAGKYPVSLRGLDPDFFSLTAHKINGSAGTGALYVKDMRTVRPLRFGGTQQHGLHPGTENTAGIAGLAVAGAARHKSLPEAIRHMADLRDRFERVVLGECPWVSVNGTTEHRVCNTTNLRFVGIDGQALMARLDGLGIYCSQSSACTNQRPEPSYVLRAMGLSETEAYESLRFSTGVLNTGDEALRAARAVAEEARKLKELFA